MNLEVRLNDWKKKLLDLGKRNGLINFKTDSRSVLRLTQPAVNELWRKVVQDEKAIEFPLHDGPDDDILRRLRKKYKTFVDEQNVNVLYLSFGFLEWQDRSSQQLLSPLILVPVSLQSASIKDPLVLKITEDEIVLNPTLSYKLKLEFGLDLPQFPDFLDEDFSAIFEKLQAFALEHNWSVRQDVYLSILSFLKINMYKDLEKHKAAILANPVINALGGKAFAGQDLAELNNFNHDSVSPAEVYNIVDADSSQLDAILCASRNISFVLQGPPGTGKSQTITNIIASKIAEGKRVLFVSEKKAALDVVYKRLKDAGLADFCLTLHSTKANKKETLSQLENVLSLSRNKANVSAAVQSKLDRLISDRDQLNAYARELNQNISPLNQSVFFANGILSQLADFDDATFSLLNVRQTTPEQLCDWVSALSELGGQLERMNNDCTSNPWHGTSIKIISHEFRHDLGVRKNIIIEGVKKLSGAGSSAGVGAAVSSVGAVVEYVNNTREYNLLNKELLADFNEGIFELDAVAMSARFQADYSNVLRVLKKGYWQDKKELLRFARNDGERGKAKAKPKMGGATMGRLLVKLARRSELVEALERQKNGVGSLEKLCNNLEKYTDSMEWFAYQFENPGELLALDFKEFGLRVTDCAENLEALENWLDFVETKERLSQMGLGEYLKVLEEMDLPSEKLVPVFKKRFYTLWLDSVLPELPAVAKFRHTNHEQLIKEFSDLDKQQLAIAQARIKSQLINALPPLDTFTSGEVNILKKELAKQRRIMPIRQLFAKIPNLLLTLKPCLLMSPLTVSQFLESESYQFDTVIFDEASQVKTENAIGAIFRGRQLIIAGDSHQLPPTNFFGSQSFDDDLDENSEDGEGENPDSSILDEAMFLPNRELLWHYRSRHEHLIAFSNAKIYKNRLVTFPANKEQVPDWGVEYIYVENGVYNSKKNPGTTRGNPVEAERVAQEVFAHIERNPDRTLGVITFGIVQEHAIEIAINRLRQEHPEHEDFFAEDKPEAFFVKSLENVQGDERDTIIFSIGYAKDAGGKMAMRFGPLSMAGGERRLNVAITRAKYNVKLVGSILPADIDTARVSQDGPKLLRQYIDFAINGSFAEVGGPAAELESPFEKSVYDFLTSKGYEVVPQLGCSGYKLDLAVRNPQQKGVFALGIECDGASYCSSRTARERDRLRQTLLELMGWKLYRLWSTDWVKDIPAERQRLLDAIEGAMGETDEKGEGKESSEISEIAGAAVEVDSDILQYEEKASLTEQYYGFEDYKICRVKGHLAEENSKALQDCILKIVELEAPVHIDIVCQRLYPLFDRKKVTPKIQALAKSAVKSLGSKLVSKYDFLYLKKETPACVRFAGSRQVTQIAYDELARGMQKVLSSNIGLTREDLLHETAKAFGITRLTAAALDRLNHTIEILENNHLIAIKNEKVEK